MVRPRLPAGARAYISAMATFYPVEIDLDGRKHRGQWALRQGCQLCVGGFYGSQTVELGDAPATARAKEVLRDLVLAWQAHSREPAPERRRARPEERPFALTVIVDRRPWNGTWALLGGHVFVSSAYGSRSVAVKRSTPERLAERLMKEIVGEWLSTR